MITEPHILILLAIALYATPAIALITIMLGASALLGLIHVNTDETS